MKQVHYFIFHLAPYDSKDGRKESMAKAYWVMPPPEHKPNEFGMPMKMNYDIRKDPSLTKELLADMVSNYIF